MDKSVLEMRKIVKEFNGVRVLDEVDFDLNEGEVHSLLGANGAGKSTLMKILSGIYSCDQGEIIIDNQSVYFKNPRDAFTNGVAIVHQELDLVPNLTVAENMFLGREIHHNNFLRPLDRPAMFKEAQKVLDSLGFEVSAEECVGNLSLAKQQLVLIARVVAMDVRIMVMDEPTTSLSINEIENLFDVINGLKARGISIIYISHYLEETFKIADRITVLRNGKKIQTAKIDECTESQIVEWMVGKADVKKAYYRNKPADNVVLSVSGLSQESGIVQNASLHVNRGEVLGIAGVVGSGRTELVKMIFGAEPTRSGKIAIEGKEVQISSPKKAVSAGIALIPENRRTEGLIIDQAINDNLVLVALNKVANLGILNNKILSDLATNMIERLKIRCESGLQQVSRLSGGNQQKVVLGKWLSVKSKLIILDQPTRGVDVGVKEQIYFLIDSLAKEGVAILLVSDELEELLNLADRILVMQKGRIIREFDNSERDLSKKDLLASMIS